MVEVYIKPLISVSRKLRFNPATICLFVFICNDPILIIVNSLLCFNPEASSKVCKCSVQVMYIRRTIVFLDNTL